MDYSNNFLTNFKFSFLLSILFIIFIADLFSKEKSIYFTNTGELFINDKIITNEKDIDGYGLKVKKSILKPSALDIGNGAQNMYELDVGSNNRIDFSIELYDNKIYIIRILSNIVKEKIKTNKYSSPIGRKYKELDMQHKNFLINETEGGSFLLSNGKLGYRSRCEKIVGIMTQEILRKKEKFSECIVDQVLLFGNKR